MRARSPVRPLITALGGAALAVALAPAGASALTISGTSVKVLPERGKVIQADAGTTDVIYYLDLHAGPTDERFSVLLQPPRFSTKGGRDEGASVDGPQQFGLYGPGTVGSVTTVPTFAPLCSSRDSAYHGYATGNATVDVHLPANANTTLAIRYSTGRRAPWVDTDYRLRFAFQSSLVGTYPDTSPLFGGPTPIGGPIDQSITREIPVAAAGGRKIGAHLILETTPKGTYGDDGGAARKIKRSAPIRVRGRLLPEVRGANVQLEWRKPSGRLVRTVPLRTGAGGRFTASLKAPGAGEFGLWASYPKQPGKLAADTTSCPLRFVAR